MSPISTNSNRSILYRAAQITSSELTPLQGQIDQLTGSFVEQATDIKSLAAMTAGGLVSRLIKIGSLNIGAQYLSKVPLLVRYGSSLAALAGESATFTGVNRAMNPFTDFQLSFKKEWLNSAISLGALKIFGKVGEGQNPVFQHFLTDAGLVAGHQLAFLTKVEEEPEGDFVSRFVKADILNWQMKGATLLTHEVAPRIHAWERSLDLILREQEENLQSKSGENLGFFPEGRWALAGSWELKEEKDANLLKMSSGEDDKKGPSDDVSSSEPRDESKVFPQSLTTEEFNNLVQKIKSGHEPQDLKVLALGDIAATYAGLTTEQLSDLVHAIRDSEAGAGSKVFAYKHFEFHPRLNYQLAREVTIEIRMLLEGTININSNTNLKDESSDKREESNVNKKTTEVLGMKLNPSELESKVKNPLPIDKPKKTYISDSAKVALASITSGVSIYLSIHMPKLLVALFGGAIAVTVVKKGVQGIREGGREKKAIEWYEANKDEALRKLQSASPYRESPLMDLGSYHLIQKEILESFQKIIGEKYSKIEVSFSLDDDSPLISVHREIFELVNRYGPPIVFSNKVDVGFHYDQKKKKFRLDDTAIQHVRGELDEKPKNYFSIRKRLLTDSTLSPKLRAFLQALADLHGKGIPPGPVGYPWEDEFL